MSTHHNGISVAVFDLDGTLVDSAPDLMGALNYTLVSEGLPTVSLPDTRALVGQGAKAMIRRALEKLEEPETARDMDRLYDVFLDHYQAHIADLTRPYPGVLDALDILQDRGVILAVCTNKLEALARRLLDQLDLTRRFAAIVGGDTAARPKPHADPLLLATSQAVGADMSAAGRRAVMVGDSAADANAARAAGLPCILVSFGYTDVPARDLGADRVIDHFDDLISAIDQVWT